jgi:hypothetical protein
VSSAVSNAAGFGSPGLASAVRATIEDTIHFHTVPDYLAAAMAARGGKAVNGTFEAVKCVRNAGHDDFKRLVVFVSADFALSHTHTSMLTDKRSLTEQTLWQSAAVFRYITSANESELIGELAKVRLSLKQLLL